MTVIAGPTVLLNERDFNEDNPIVLYKSAVALGFVAADSETTFNPASNLANNSTDEFWQSASTSEQLVTVSILTGELVDTVGIARHNFGSARVAISVEGNVGAGYSQLTEPIILKDDAPALFRITCDAYTGIRLRLTPAGTAPRMAVLFVGKHLKLQRRVYVGHTPITLARQRKFVPGRSENGNFLGRVMVGSGTASSISLANLEPGWYRDKMEPFLRDADAWFFAWRPQGYPREIGYVWLTSDPMPKNTGNNGTMSVELAFAGITS